MRNHAVAFFFACADANRFQEKYAQSVMCTNLYPTNLCGMYILEKYKRKDYGKKYEKDLK